jgi:PAS domain S-box-containing protein
MGVRTVWDGATRPGPQRWLENLGAALSGSPAATHGLMSNLISAVALSCAVLPFTGWRLPLGWLLVMAVLVVAEHYVTRLRAAANDRRINPFTWLLSAGYSAAAFYLTLVQPGPAQTLGVTLYGLVMFHILARDYAQPRRLFINLLAPIASVVLVQGAAATLYVSQGKPWQIVTLLASPYIVFRAFRAVHHNLSRSHRLEREAVDQLTDSEIRYRMLAEHSPDIIVRYDTRGRIEYFSPAVRLYGYEPEPLIGRNISEFLDPHDFERNVDFLEKLASGRPLPLGEDNIWRSWSADGKPLNFEGATSPILDDQGRIIGAVAVLRDVTARLALQEELRSKRAEAEAATMAKSQFLANMSHEIRTPLTGVIGFAGLLEAVDGLPAQARQYVDRIHNSAKALLSVVNDVLDFSKLEARQVELDPKPLDPRAFIEQTADLVRDQAARKGLKIVVASLDGLPASLMADGPRLRQVLLNLLTNAVKFTEAGQVGIEARYEAEAGRFRVAVRDTGVGVPEELAGRLFQRFSQIDGSNSRQHGGTGLGLAISKGLVEMMGGEIGVDSVPGQGSTFWFTIAAPALAGEAAPANEMAEDIEVGRLRLLVVDDVTVNRELVSAMLAPFDVAITQAASGAEAVSLAMAAAFDLILMDLQMPGMDGLAATAAIRAGAGPNLRTPILALTANVLPDQIEACRRGGMDDHVGKPIDPKDLLSKIAQWTTPDEAGPARLSA